MANPLDIVTQDQRTGLDDNGNPLRRVYITGSDVVPVDQGDAFQPPSSNRLVQAVAPPQDDILSLIAQVKDYLTGAGGAVNDAAKRFTNYDRQLTEDVLNLPRRIYENPGKANEVGQRLIGGDNWAANMVKSGATLPRDVMSGEEPIYVQDPVTGEMVISPRVVERSQDMAGLAGGSTLFAKPGTGTLGSGAMRPGPKAMPAAEAPVFYSAIEHATTNAAQDVMTGPQWAGFLKNQPGVKAEELAWTGLPEWLSAQKGKVSKEDVQRYLDEHKVEIKDVTKEAGPVSHVTYDDVRAAERDAQRTGDWSAFERMQEVYEAQELNQQGTTKYSSYQLPGGENYREHLLTLPPVEEPLKFRMNSAGGMNRVSDKNYRSSHWDEPNVLAHVRTNDRDVGGVPSLHVEEIQSDWHQQGRKQGYRGEGQDTAKPIEAKLKELGYEIATGRGLRKVGSTEDARFKADTPKEALDLHKDWLKASEFDTRPRVPDAPFKTSWPELALKRMIRMAAEEGKTRISWTPGEAQAARYDLSKQLSNITLSKYKDGTTRLTTYKPDGHVAEHRAITDLNELPNLIGKDLAEKLVNSKSDLDLKVEGSGKDWYIRNGDAKVNHFNSKKDAEEVLRTRQKDLESVQGLDGLDLKVGGEGMKGFYDNMLPKMVEKLGKAHGVKVQKSKIEVPNPDAGWMSGEKAMNLLGDDPKWKIPAGEDARSAWFSKLTSTQRDKFIQAARKADKQTETHDVHYFDIPPAWRDQALRKGFPLYLSGVPFPLTPVDHDPFAKKEK